MFGKIAAEALGISDIGKIIPPKDYHKVDADDYIFNEDDEKIYFVIKSKTDEYCFTDRALIHIDGTSAVSKKRLVRRYDYYLHPVSEVFLETAGTIDLDVEIKFSLGGRSFSIDVNKNQLEELKDLYKSLTAIARKMSTSKSLLDCSINSLSMTASTFNNIKIDTEVNLNEDFKALNEYIFNCMKDSREKYIVKSFSDIFDKYINN
nr:PH domain-containing protein [uncultured Cetobacterium sp.]